MEMKGRAVGLASALLSGIFIAAVMHLLLGHGLHGTLSAALLVTAVFMPICWFFGLQYDKLADRSMRDPLTSAFNRTWFASWFPRLIRHAERRSKKVTVSLIDINDFKQINDQYGHLAGDQVLLLIADSLRRCAAKGELVVRWGGDEFLLICPYGSNRDKAALYRWVNESLEKLSLRVGMRVSASVGTAVYPEDGKSIQELLHSADQRMYTDKEEKKKPAEQEAYSLRA